MAEDRIADLLGVIGSGLQDVERPGTLAAFMLQRDLRQEKDRQAQALESQRQANARLTESLVSPGAPVQGGRFTPEQQKAILIAANQGSKVAMELLKGMIGQKEPQGTTLERNLQAAGLQPGTPEFQKAILNKVSPSGELTPFQKQEIELKEERLGIDKAKLAFEERRQSRLEKSEVLREKLLSSLIGGEEKAFNEANKEARINSRDEIKDLLGENKKLRALTLDPSTKDFAVVSIDENNRKIKQIREVEKFRSKATASVKGHDERITRAVSAVDNAISKIGATTAGFIGSKVSGIEGTKAFDVKSILQTIQAIIGFDELKTMRAESPTGGALGQVSERELEFLQSTIANLNQGQTPAQLRDNLNIVRKALLESKTRLMEAYVQDYGSLEGFEQGSPSNRQKIPADTSGEPLSFSSEEQAEAAGVKPGDTIIINGVLGVWE